MAFQDRPIQQKLLLVILVTASAALLIAGAGIIVWDQIVFRQRLAEDVRSIAEIAAHNTRGALAFDDPSSASETLAALQAKPHIISACIYKPGGTVLARYWHSSVPEECAPAAPSGALRQVGAELQLATPVLLQNQPIGTLALRYDLDEIYDRGWLFGLTLLGILLGSNIAALVLSRRLRESITTPIIALAKTSKEVSQKRDYSLRAAKLSGDELGSLVDAFNEMLETVQRREEDLRQAHDELERRVEERTKQLSESEERFRSLVERVEEYAIFQVDTEGRIVTWNRGAEKLKGYKAEEIIGRHLRIFYPPEDRRRADLNLEIARQKGSAEDEGWRVRKDGSRFWSNILITALRTEDGRLLGFSKITRDLTERKQQEEALRLLADVTGAANSAENLDTAISLALREIGMQRDWQVGQAWLLDQSGEFLWCTPRSFYARNVVPGFRRISLERRFGKGEGLPGRIWEQERPLWVEDFPSRLEYPRARFATEAGLKAAFGFPIRYGDAIWGIFEFFTDEERAPDAAFLNTAQTLGTRLGDIFGRKQAEETVRQRAEELTRSNADLAQFAYVASHDLQEPLRMVVSYMQIIAEQYKGKLDADADEFIGFAVEGATRMRQLISGLLAYSRVGSGGQQIVPVNLNETMAEVASNLQVAIRETGAKVTCDTLPTVLADSSQMIQLFQNLVGNALTYHGPEHPRVHISSTRDDSFWSFSVTDNGIGIAAEHHERIFRIFQRLHDRMQHKGTGMGLAICKRIVERRGGKIWVESQTGQGSTFRFTIPADSPEALPEMRANFINTERQNG